MGAFLDKLKQMSASSGRVIDERGARQNWADLVRKMSQAMDPFDTVRISE